MKITLINTAEDMGWLRDVHIPRLAGKYKSAVIHGNEDWPDKIEVYVKRDPDVTDVPVVYTKEDRDTDFRVAGKIPPRRSKKTSRKRR